MLDSGMYDLEQEIKQVSRAKGLSLIFGAVAGVIAMAGTVVLQETGASFGVTQGAILLYGGALGFSASSALN